jgi:hypothetical protein
LNPRTWVSEASTLPLHHRSRYAEALVVASKETGLSTWPCLEIRMQDEFTLYRLITVPFKGWMSSDIWEQL